MDDDTVMQRWQQLSAQVTQMAEKAAGDNAYCASLGLDEHAMSRARDQPAPLGDAVPKATLLRALAQKIIPREFEWDVQLAMGGNAYLVLRNVRDIETPLTND